MSDQLEFDLVSPFLGEPAVCRRLLAESKTFADLAEEKFQEARLQARLSHEDLSHAPITDELDQLKVLIGTDEWQRTHKLWEYRARKNPRRFRKVLIAVKNLVNL